jgi:HEAT repeat protein
MATLLLAADQGPGPEESVRAAAKQLEELHLTGQGAEANEYAARLMAGDRKHAAAVLTLVLRNREINTRSHIISAVERAGLKEAAPVLIELLEDPDEGIRSWSAIALGTVGDKAAVAALERRLKTEPSKGVLHRVRVALGRLGQPYLQYFIAGLSDRNIDRRYQCLVALGELKDKRAVPYLVKLLDGADTWEPRRAAECLTRITGIENTTVTKTTVRPDGSVQTEGRVRPVHEFKKDVLQWIAKHRDAAGAPVETPAELWSFTPEPFLPGLKVSFAMSPEQVVEVCKNAGVECRRYPEMTWEEGGSRFHSAERVEASQSCLAALNKRLAGGIVYVFDQGRLEKVQFTLIGRGDAALDPLKEPLRLEKTKEGGWTGLDGTIVVGPWFGDAEKESFVIPLNVR